MWAHMCYIEGSNHSPLPVGYALANAAQYAVILHCHKGPLVTHSNCRLGPQGLFFFFFFFGAIRLSLLIFMKGSSAFGVSRYLWMAAIPVTILATSLNRVSWVCMMHSVPPLRSLMKALNYTTINLWGILFIITYSSKCWYHSLVLHTFSQKMFRTDKLTYTSNSVVPEFSNSLPAVLVLEGRTE